MKKILLGLLVCAGMCACTNDDVVVSNSTSKVLDGDVAYLTVKINDVGSGTRATEGTYQPGSEAEYNVTDAYFYFYDEEGLFVSRAEVWDGGEVNPSTATDYPNVEFKGETVIVLKGLTDVGFPRYMVTILNEPSNFEDAGLYEPATTLDAFQTKLAHATQVGIYDANDNFVMSTSAYAGGEGDDRGEWYFVTTLEDENFRPEPIDEDEETNPVEVYVERLAAKVEVGVAEGLSNTATTITDAQSTTHTAYLLKETIAGDPNEQDDLGEENPDERTDIYGEQDIYVEFLGWALNATARYSNIVKDITPFATEGAPTAVDGWPAAGAAGATSGYWNAPGDYRSFWGASFNYGIEASYPTTNINPNVTYPTGQDANYDSNESSTDATEWLNPYLKYTSLVEDNLHPLVASESEPYNYDYCAENTNTAEVLVDKNSSAITSVLLKAQAWYVNDNGTAVPITLVRYRGELFTESAFKNYVVQELDINGTDYVGLYYSTEALTGGTTSSQVTLTQFDGQFLYTVNEGNGYIGVALNETAMESYYWYWLTTEGTYAQIGTGQGGDTELYTALEGEITTFNEYWSASTSPINEYAGGLMYYSIPIEHLNNTEPTTQGASIVEAQYGVVRNHWYQLSITALTQLGKGIVDEDEVIVPDPTEPTYYYVGANINILSWKLVSQGVSL